MRAWSPREARLVAILLLLAAIALLRYAIVGPLVEGFTSRAGQREQLLARYAANERTIAAIPRLGRAAAARDQQTAQFVLAAPDVATAADRLRERLQAAAQAEGAEFRGGEDIAGPPGMAQTRAVFRVPAGGLPRLLARIENGSPLPRITALGVSSDEALVTGAAANLEVKIDVAIAFRPSRAR